MLLPTAITSVSLISPMISKCIAINYRAYEIHMQVRWPHWNGALSGKVFNTIALANQSPHVDIGTNKSQGPNHKTQTEILNLKATIYNP